MEKVFIAGPLKIRTLDKNIKDRLDNIIQKKIEVFVGINGERKPSEYCCFCCREEKDREIILQSLFSRVDTGLLKGDSSPTMPDGLLGQIVKNIGG